MQSLLESLVHENLKSQNVHIQNHSHFRPLNALKGFPYFPLLLVHLHLSCFFTSLELPQEAGVVFVLKADVVYAVFKAGHPVHTYAKGKRAPLMRIKTAVFKLMRIGNAAAQYFKPARALAHTAALAAADSAGNINLGRGFSEREVARAHTGLYVRPKYGMHKIDKRALQIGKA